MNNYNNFLKWACVYFIDRSTQDDHRSKIQVIGLFENPIIIEDYFINNLPNKEIKRYILHIDDIKTAEKFYNDIQELQEKYGKYWIYNLNKLNYTVDEQNKYRSIFNLWTN